ncbi:MAG: glycosyltransferase [Actinobacteria bacterium]|nr:glycosyltransferase [Actinomycetota bacterium]
MVTATTGGQTRALLMRNRLFAEHGGVAPTIVTFDPRPHYPRTRERLTAAGQLAAPVTLRNLYEDHAGPVPRGTHGPLEPLPGFETRYDHADDGTVYRRRLVHPSSHADAVHEYLRTDGSVFLRTTAGEPTDSPVRGVVLVDEHGDVVRRWPDQRAWRQDWLRSLVAPDERAFVISDSRFALAHVVPFDDERFHVLHLVHNVHVCAPRHWSSPAQPGYGPLLDSLEHLDALVTLTHRQRADVADRCGARSNLFVVPNPVEAAPVPVPAPARERCRFAVVARLSPQKDLVEAVRVFALVVAREPAARLDIYGEGPTRPDIQAEIEALGLGGHVVLRGHDPQARDHLLTATAFVMTSRLEGYPLATLESMARGCPVVAYDVKYGPREQVTDGRDGWVVPAGDRAAMADRLVALTRDPGLLARVSAGARATAARHGPAAFLDDWANVLDAVVAARPRRTSLDDVRLVVHSLGSARRLRVPRSLDRVPVVRRWGRARSAAAAGRRSRRLGLRATLEVSGRSRAATLDDAVLTLDAVSDRTGDVVPLPLAVRRVDVGFELSSQADVADLLARAGSATTLRLRLRLVWENSAWESTVHRPRWLTMQDEVSYTDTGALTLHRRR